MDPSADVRPSNAWGSDPKKRSQRHLQKLGNCRSRAAALGFPSYGKDWPKPPFPELVLYSDFSLQSFLASRAAVAAVKLHL
jgi:hypothetical protein